MLDTLWLCRVGRQVVNIPSFVVGVDWQKHVNFSSPDHSAVGALEGWRKTTWRLLLRRPLAETETKRIRIKLWGLNFPKSKFFFFMAWAWTPPLSISFFILIILYCCQSSCLTVDFTTQFLFLFPSTSSVELSKSDSALCEGKWFCGRYRLCTVELLCSSLSSSYVPKSKIITGMTPEKSSIMRNFLIMMGI